MQAHKGWTIHTTPDAITATKGGEELTIHKFGTRGMQLMKNAIDRREDETTNHIHNRT